MSNKNRLAKQVEKWYGSFPWFQMIFGAGVLWMAFALGVLSGWNALIDIEHTVSRNAVYERMDIQTITRNGKRRNEVYMCFEDGTRVEVQVNTSPLKQELQGVEAGEELFITLDKSEAYLLGVEYRGEVLMDAEDSVKRMNISAYGFMMLGALMGTGVPIMMIRDVVRGIRRKRHKK